jgi:hypothetical protein
VAPVKILPTTCPWCDRVSTEATDHAGGTATPDTGAVMICEQCADFSIYVCPGLARRPTEAERLGILATPAILREILAAEERLRNAR